MPVFTTLILSTENKRLKLKMTASRSLSSGTIQWDGLQLQLRGYKKEHWAGINFHGTIFKSLRHVLSCQIISTQKEKKLNHCKTVIQLKTPKLENCHILFIRLKCEKDARFLHVTKDLKLTYFMIAVAMTATNHDFTYKTLYLQATDLGRYLSLFVPSLPI